MNCVKFIRDPGYIWDLISVFLCHFNRTYCLSNYINYDKAEADTEFFTSTMYEFSNIYTISDESLLFFFIKDHGKCFLSEYYFDSYKNKFAGEYSFTYLQRLLVDHQNIIRNVCKYYFPQIEEDKLDFYCGSISNIGELIANSEYDTTIQNRLYYFFINPLSVIQKLNYDLLSINDLLTKYYERHYKTISNIQNKIDFDDLVEQFKLIDTQKYIFDEFESIYVSISLFNKNSIKFFPNNKEVILVLGYDYKDLLSFLIARNNPINLDEIANILREKNRVSILDYLLEKGEMSIKDIESELKTSSQNAYYHVNMMVKANMIKLRNEGKMLLYSLNKNHFDAILSYLEKYSNKKVRGDYL